MLVRADALAQRYGSRAAELLGVDLRADPLLAWWVDEAAALAGFLSGQQEAAQPAPQTPEPPRRRNQVVMLGGVPVVTGVIERE